jgi:hypothetical protein
VRHLCALLLGCWAANKLPLRLHPEDRDNQEKKETYMSKNLTRKGLALGAVVALGTTLFAGAPAQAASVLFAPTTGTGNTLVAGETFSLTASLSSDLPSGNSGQLKFKVVNTNGVKVPAISLAVGANTYVTTGGTNAVNYATSGSTDAIDASSNNWITTAPAAGDAKVFGAGNATSHASEAGNPTSISITSTKDTTDSFTVTAFLDANNNGAIDAGELSAVQPVNFVKIANAGATVSFTGPSTSATSLSATVSFGADVNVGQLSINKYKLNFGKYLTTGEIKANGTVSTDTLDASTAVAVAKNTALTGFKLAATYSATITASTYGAQLWSNATDGSTFVAIGTEVLAAAGSAQATVVTALGAAVTDNSTAATVRSGTVSAAFTQTIKKETSVDDSTIVAVGAGVPVTYTISSAPTLALDSASVADTMTVNGVALTTSASQYPVTGTVLTDAAGKISIPVVTRAGIAGTAVTISTVPTNAASNLSSSATLTWTAADRVAAYDVSIGNTIHTVVKGGTFSASYALTDSFHALVTGDAYRVRFTELGAGTATTSNTVYASFVNGIATVSVADNSTAAGTNSASITVEKNVNGQWLSGSALTAVSSHDSALQSVVDVSFRVLAVAPVATAVTAVASVATASIDTADTFATVNQGTAYNSTVPSLTDSTGNIKRTITGTVTDVNGVGIAGASVTISAPGVQFVAGASAPKVYSIGTITVVADAIGGYTVDVYSHVAGAVVYTVTSGAATKTVKITYTSVSGYSTASSMTVAGPTTSQASRAAAFTATVVDKLGNVVGGVALKATLTGVGSFAGATSADGSLAITTSSTGVATVTVLFGANDLGDTVVSFADATGQTTPIAAVAKTVTVGATDAQVDIVNNRVTAVTSFSKGKNVAFYVDGVKKWSKLSASDADVVLNYNLKKGTHTVTVKISGGFVTTEKFIVK